jgi:hypothetical protein
VRVADILPKEDLDFDPYSTDRITQKEAVLNLIDKAKEAIDE